MFVCCEFYMLHQLVYEYLIKLSAFHDRFFAQNVASIRMHTFTDFILLLFLVFYLFTNLVSVLDSSPVGT